MRGDSRHPALLARQLWLLAAFAGIFASRELWPAVVCLFLIIIHQHKRIFAGRGFALFFLCGILLFFGLGAGYAGFRSAIPQPPPRWVPEASDQAAQMHMLLERNRKKGMFLPGNTWAVSDNLLVDKSNMHKKQGVESLSRKGLRLEAKVVRVEGRPDRELRLLLGDLRPLDPPGEPWAGKLAFNWRESCTPEGKTPLPPGLPHYLLRNFPGVELPARPLVGQIIELKLRPRRVSSLLNPGLWETESYWADRGVSLRAWEQGGKAELALKDGEGFFFAAAALREALRQRVLAALPREAGADGWLQAGAAIVPALLFGDKYLLNSSDTELFARSTLAHSLALSGLHLGYAASLGYFAVFLLYRARPLLSLRLPRRKAALVGGALPALCYLWLGGAPPSLLRAALMLLFVGWALLRERPLALADALLWALFVILLWNPAAAFDLRLQLSALCIAALAWAQPLFSLLYRRLGGAGLGMRLLRGGALLLLSSLIIQLALAPLLVKSFGLYGLAMPLNLLWLPVLGALVMPFAFMGLAAAALHLDILAGPLFQAAVFPCGVLLELLRWLDSAGLLAALWPPRPHWLSMLGLWFLLLLLGRKVSRPKLILAVALVVVPFLWPDPGGVRLRLLDVGQGQSVLVEWGARRLLVDGGGGANPRFDVGREVVAATLAQNRIPKLDYMLASHLDLDHAGGLVFPLKHLRVGYYADNGGKPENARAKEIMRLLDKKRLERNVLRAGDVLALGAGLALEVLHPDLPREAAPPNPNRDSLVLRLLWQGRPLALICGDVDKAAQREMLRRLGPGGLSAEILVLPHHGAASSLLPEFYRAVSPRLALASAGYGNYWNFPSPAVKNALLEEKIPLLSTARAGQILLAWDEPEAALRLSTARYGRLFLHPEKK